MGRLCCVTFADWLKGKADEKAEALKVETPTTGIASSSSKANRSMFLFVHLLILCFVMGHYFIFSPYTGGVVCRVARLSALIFLKPFFLSTLYCLNYMTDTQGWMLWHNPITDSIVSVLFVLLLIWLVVSLIFALPILVCFVFYGVVFFIPPIAYFIVNYKKLRLSYKKYDRKEATESEVMEADGAVVILKRLLFYSVFAGIVFASYLYPFYLGEDYIHAVKRVGSSIEVSLGWPAWRVSFSWPEVSFPNQLALSVSLSAFSMEYALMAWSVVLSKIYPRGYAHDGVTEDKPLCGKRS